jgi:hypothetical protein
MESNIGSQAMKYRYKPHEVEAMQLTPETIGEVLNWLTDHIDVEIASNGKTGDVIGVFIGSSEANVLAQLNDYIVKEEALFYVRNPAAFARQFEPLNQ